MHRTKVVKVERRTKQIHLFFIPKRILPSALAQGSESQSEEQNKFICFLFICFVITLKMFFNNYFCNFATPLNFNVS